LIPTIIKVTTKSNPSFAGTDQRNHNELVLMACLVSQIVIVCASPIKM